MDLVAYSDVANMLEENLDVIAVKTFEDQVQSFVDSGLREVGLSRNETVLGTAGDNAILLFDDAATMHRFAQAVQTNTVSYNRTKTTPLAKRWFRMGAATGIVMMVPAERRIIGSTIARAVRLEASANKGQLIIDVPTFEALPDDIKKAYGGEEIVKGKREEQFHVHRCTLVEVPEGDGGPAFVRHDHDKTPAPRAASRWSVQIKAAAAALVAALAVGVAFAFVQSFSPRGASGAPEWSARLDATKVFYPNPTGEQIWSRGVVLTSRDGRSLDTAIFAPFDNFGEIKRFTLIGRRLTEADFAPWRERWAKPPVPGQTPAELSKQFDEMIAALETSGEEIGKVTRVLRADNKWDETVVGKGLSIVANGTTPHIGPLENPIGNAGLLFVFIQLDCIPGSHPDMAGANEDWLGHRFSWATQESLALIDSSHGRPIDTTSLRTMYRTAAGPVDISTLGVSRVADSAGIFLQFGRSQPTDYDRVTWVWAK